MTDYKETLNFFKVDFPMRANLAKREVAWVEHWQSAQFYQRIREHCHGRPKYVLHDGPPYANGAIHIGHAVNKILKDMIVRIKTLSGYDAPYRPGWDCHGMPIELQVEKNAGKISQVADLLKACRQYAQQQVDQQKKDFIRLGVLADWQGAYQTMTPKQEADEIRALRDLYLRGFLVKGQKPVNWCIECESALAEAEVEYEEKESLSLDVGFQVLKLPEALADLKIPLIQAVIWTTTPWTLVANEAVCLHPEIDYQFVQTTRGTYILAQSLLQVCLERYGAQLQQVIATVKGEALAGAMLQHPFYADKQVPIVLGTHVSTDAGTGLVHTAPAHGADDYLVGQQYQLGAQSLVLGNGCYSAQVPLFAGKSVREVNEEIVHHLEKEDALLSARKICHSYPHCWRHGTAIIFRATEQWFVPLDQALPECDDTLRQRALSVLDQVDFYPSWGKSRLVSMIAHRPDWCLSRQRRWGVPMPFLVHKEHGGLHPDSAQLLEKVAQRVEQEGIEAWHQISVTDLLDQDADQYQKMLHTVDVWFDSGVTHRTVLKQDPSLNFPADLYLEGSDQHRGWFHSSLLSGCILEGKAPYQALLTHGFVVDGQGRKMSKSKGNVIYPQRICDAYGADILRLWVAQTDYTGEMNLSPEILKQVVDGYRRIRNTLRFILSNLVDYRSEEEHIAWQDLVEMDRYFLFNLRQFQDKVLAAFEVHEFHRATREIHLFCSEDLSAFYLDILKDRLYTERSDSKLRKSAQSVLWHIVQVLTRLLLPIIPFTAEEVWQILSPGDLSAMLLQWHLLPQPNLSGPDLLPRWNKIRALRSDAMKRLEEMRTKGELSTFLQAELCIAVDAEDLAWLSQMASDLRFVFMASEVKFVLKAPDLLQVQAARVEHAKCVRCWHYCPEVGQVTDHPELCQRCVDNIAERVPPYDASLRQYA